MDKVPLPGGASVRGRARAVCWPVASAVRRGLCRSGETRARGLLAVAHVGVLNPRRDRLLLT